MKPVLNAATALSIALLAGTTIGTSLAPVSAVAADASAISVPDTVDPGQSVSVTVDGAPLGSQIELWGPVTQSGGGSRVSSSPLVGGTAEVIAPAGSGSYQLRYVSDGGKVMASRAFDVAAVPVVLTVQTPMQAGGAMQVTWQGPATAGDRFEITDAAGTVLESTPVAGDPGTQNVSTLTVPQQKGSLRLRYVTAAGDVLRSIGFDAQ